MRLLLDLAGVLAHFDSDARLNRLAKLAGLQEETVRTRLYESGFVAAADAGELDASGVRDGLRARLGVPVDDDTIEAAWASAFTPDPAVVAVAARIGATGVPVGVLTNNDALLAQVLPARLPTVFAPVTAGLFFAGAIGAAKPDARAWQVVLDAWQVPAGEVVFVDDKVEYADRATELGLVGVHFTDAERLGTELDRVLVL